MKPEIEYPSKKEPAGSNPATATEEITKDQLIDVLTISLPKAEAEKLRALANKMEANAKANRERVAAHKAGISVAEYRKKMAGQE